MMGMSDDKSIPQHIVDAFVARADAVAGVSWSGVWASPAETQRLAVIVDEDTRWDLNEYEGYPVDVRRGRLVPQ